MPSTDPLIPKKPNDSSSSSQDNGITSTVKKRSFLPGMVVIVLLFPLMIFSYSYAKQVLTLHQALTLSVAPLLQTLWSLCVVHLGKRGTFSSRQFLESMPIFWLYMIPVTLQMSVWGPNMTLLMQVLDAVPIQAFVALQGLRSLAVGSLVKWYHGLFPMAFALLTGVPDFLFGLSALALLCMPALLHDTQFLLWWNVVGFVIIVPCGALVLQLGMKPTQLYQQRKHASNDLIFAFPMVLAPAVVVPILVSWNALLALWASGALEQNSE